MRRSAVVESRLLCVAGHRTQASPTSGITYAVNNVQRSPNRSNDDVDAMSRSSLRCYVMFTAVCVQSLRFCARSNFNMYDILFVSNCLQALWFLCVVGSAVKKHYDFVTNIRLERFQHKHAAGLVSAFWFIDRNII